MVAGPVVGNAAANCAAENIEIKLNVGAFVIQSRPIDDDVLKIEPAGEIHSANREAVFLPFRRAAQLRKCLSKQRRGNREFAGGEPPGFDLISRNSRVAKQNDGWPILNSQVEMPDVEINRQQFLQCPPVEPRRLCRLRVIAANFSARGLDRQSVNAVAAAGQNFCETKAKNCVLAAQFNMSGGAGLIGDADPINRNRTQERSANFSDVDL